MIRFAALLLLAALSVVTHDVTAHEMTMAEMEVRETAPGDFIWMWTASERRPAGEELTPVWPNGCKAEAGAVRCGSQGLKGTLEMTGVGESYSAALVKVFWLDGQRTVYTFTKAQSTAQLFGSANDTRSWGEIARAYGVLGVEHILSGFDHLLFVIALLFLVKFSKRLVDHHRIYARAQRDLGAERTGLAHVALTAGRSDDCAVDPTGRGRGIARSQNLVASMASAGRLSVRIGSWARLCRRASGNRLASTASERCLAHIQCRCGIGSAGRGRICISCASQLRAHASIRACPRPGDLCHRHARSVLVH